MNECIDAKELFTIKEKAYLADNANKRIFVCNILRRNFYEHLDTVSSSPNEIGWTYFPVPANDISSQYLLSNGFLRDNIEYFNNFLNNEFRQYNYSIALEFTNVKSHAYLCRYKPIYDRVPKKGSFWNKLFKRK